MAFVNLACGENRISGTYISDGNDFTEMLQLTQTDNGHLVGVMSTVSVSSEGNINSRQCQITGEIDHGQITLLCHYGLFDDANLAGTVNWNGNAIHFQWADAKGQVLSSVFQRASAEKFQKSVSLLHTLASERQLNGIYVMYKDGDDHLNIMRLAQTDKLISGDLNGVKIDAVGKINTFKCSISGSVDNFKISLACCTGPFSCTTAKGSIVKRSVFAIETQDGNAVPRPTVYVRTSASVVQTYVDHLKTVAAQRSQSEAH